MGTRQDVVLDPIPHLLNHIRRRRSTVGERLKRLHNGGAIESKEAGEVGPVGTLDVPAGVGRTRNRIGELRRENKWKMVRRKGQRGRRREGAEEGRVRRENKINGRAMTVTSGLLRAEGRIENRNTKVITQMHEAITVGVGLPIPGRVASIEVAADD
jgi:hypothetical protein